jgi:hypothetical protein
VELRTRIRDHGIALTERMDRERTLNMRADTPLTARVAADMGAGGPGAPGAPGAPRGAPRGPPPPKGAPKGGAQGATAGAAGAATAKGGTKGQGAREVTAPALGTKITLSAS